MMLRGHTAVEPDDTCDEMTLSLVIDGGDPITAALPPSKVDELVEKIGLARAAMSDRLISGSGPLTVLEFSVCNPSWRARADISFAGAEADSIAMGLRRTQYGWLSFVLPDCEARALGQWLVQATAPDPRGHY
jgi:hypothetical protein